MKHALYILPALLLCTGLLLSFKKIDATGNDGDAKAEALTDSLDIKIGQMIMLGINDRTALPQNDALRMDLASGKLGGIILFEKNIDPKAPATALKQLTAGLQRASASPLFISIDEEGGQVHRLKEKYGFVAMPSAAHLGRLNNADSTTFYNLRLARELMELGINFNYAPTLDMAVNPANPVIVKKDRSFSARPEIITKHALLAIEASHRNGVKTILKHFPGHGSSATDSHLGIVDVTNTWTAAELLPYANIIRTGNIDAIMTAHIINRHWDASGLPATLSKKVVTGMLRGDLGYNGVVFSDDMQMGAISQQYGFEHAVTLSINAGVDVLMFGNNVGKPKDRKTAAQVHAMIKKLVLDGQISKDRINESYRRITALKRKQF